MQTRRLQTSDAWLSVDSFMVSLMVSVSLSVELKLVFERFSVRLQSTFYTDRLLKLDAMRALKSETATGIC